MNQIPFVDVTFVDNPEPRCPCVLLVDTSGSMQGAPINSLNQGLAVFASELMQDRLAQKRVEVAVVTFGEEVSLVQDFCSPAAFIPPTLQASGRTPMGEAVVRGMQIIEDRKTMYKQAGVNYFRPWIFLITDGTPTDENTYYWQQAVESVRAGEANRHILFFGVAVNEADRGMLNQLCPPNRPSLKLNGLSFRELFTWLSSSLKSVSSANPGSQLALPPPNTWATIDV
jgi:uncharacterized protein YegL